MPGRATSVLLGAGALVVLALGIGLFQLTRSTEPVPPITGRPVAAAPAPTASLVEPPHPAAPIEARAPTPAPPPPPSARVAAPAAPPELPPPPAGVDHELKRDADGKLVPIIRLRELREQMQVTAAPVKECIERSGVLPTGKATLFFTVGEKDHKVVVDSTGIQESETLAQWPALLDCLGKTATQLTLGGYAVPELGTPIYVRRYVRLENGQLADDELTEFSYRH